MSSSARVIFTRLRAADGRALHWREHSRDVLDRPVDSEHVIGRSELTVTGHAEVVLVQESTEADALTVSGDESDVFVWHLVSANQRMLARSSSQFRDLSEATCAAELLLAAGAGLTVSTCGDQAHGRFGWFAGIDGVAMITCARWYPSERDRQHSIRLVTSALGSALLRPGAREVTHL